VDRRRFQFPEENSNDPKLKVNNFEFTGVNSIDIDYLNKAFLPFEGQSFTPKQLLELTDLITDTYRVHDIAAVARIPAQDVKNGTIRFDIHESNFVGTVIDHGFEDHFNVPLDRVEAVASLPLSDNSTLILSERERQQLLTIDMHGISVSGGLQVNDDGDQELELWVENSDTLSGTIDINNNGFSDNAEEQAVLTSILYSPFRRGGASYLNAIKSAQSDYLSLSYRGPIGLRGSTLDLQAGALSADTGIKRHQATSYSLGIRYPLIRTLSSNLFLSVIAEHRHLKESSTSVTDRDYKVDTLRVTLDGNRAFNRDRLTYRLQTTLGKTNLNNSPNRVDDLVHAHTQGAFNTLSGFLTYQMRLTDHWQLLTNVQGQLSGKNLDDSQRFIAGGSQGLRGFSANELLVDQGALIRIDMIKQLNDKWRLGGFIDWARVEKRNNNSNINGTPLEVNNRMNAYNWGLTSTYRSEESLRIDLTLAQALSDTLGVITDQGDVQAMLNLKWTF
jgi:hemolysin activation/secretion protein